MCLKDSTNSFKKKKKDSTNRICIKIKLYTLNKIYNLCCVPIFY